jgi:sugar phosphate permease
LLVGLPGLILAFLVARMRDPRRGASERLPATAGLRTSGLFGYKLLAIPTIVFVILMQACTFFVLGGLSFWTPTYLGQRFDLSVGTAGLLAGALFVVGGGAGTLGGGYLADQLAKRNLGARMLVPAWCSLLGAVFIAVALVMPSLALFLLGYMVAGGLLSAYSGPLTALLQDVAPPAGRARAVALSLLLAHLLGDAFSPTLLGSIADMFGGVAAGGLDKAFFLAPIAAVAAGILGMSGARFAGRDRAAMLASIEREAA